MNSCLLPVFNFLVEFKNDYFRFMKSIMNNIIIDKNKKEAIVKKDLNFFRGE